MKIQTSRILLLLFTACMATIAIPLRTLAQSAPESPIFPNEEAEAILKKACDTLRTKQAFTVDVDITYDNVLDSGEKVQYSAFQQLSVKRPNQLRADYTGDERHSSFYYDGKTFSLLAKKANLYATRPAPATIDAAIAEIEEKYDVTIPLSKLVVSDPCSEIAPNIKKSTYIGFDMVNRVPSYHFLFTGEEKDFQVWISDEAEPVPQKLVITYKELPGAPQYTAIFSNWNFKPQISANTFSFTPPAGTGKIEFLPSELK
ncbi:DUF2092 domain-containing protein [Pseudanabaena sp. PCC 6802]|uniref:DUF2092 domain-containing protein n=1 Tax=Pseudanabaena sp. PCC 6802 TaxID=118173 RepID=UPI00034C1AFB|nr:DUF2092 domain-containing protein [Pseudanabaena sp. PCC 6802]